MKKVLSFVLVLSMILGSFGMAFAAPASDVVETKYEDAVNMLTELDVISGYTDGTFKPGKEVTRAEMATFIIKALNLDEYATAGSTFEDMKGHWADGFVGYAASLQIVAGRTATTFDPDAKVTYDEAITMIVQALGYQGKYMVGGFPGAFVNKAKALGLLDGVVAGKADAVRGDIALMIYNALGKNFVRYDVNGYEQPVTGDTMMKRLTGATTTFGGVVVGDEEALINIKEYQGAQVKGLKNADGKIVAIEEVESIFLEGDLNASGYALTLADDTEYKLNRVAASSAAMFVNGVENGTAAATTLTGKAVKMAVEVSGKYITKVYSFAVWTPTATIKWDADDAEALTKATPKLDGKNFVMTDSDEIDTKEFVLEGAASLKDIKKDSIVTYYLADVDGLGGNEIAKVQVSTDVVEGKVTEVTKAGKLVIGGKEYAIASFGDNYAVANITDGLGAEGKFFLNAAGKIAYTDTTAAAADDYAIVLLPAGNNGTGYDAASDFKIKMVGADGTKIFDVTKKCFNEKASAEAITPNALVAYTLDKDGAVNDIVTVDAISKSGIKLTAKGYLDGYKVSKNVVVFKPGTGDEDAYVVADMSVVPVDEALNDTQYVLNDDKEVVVVITNDVEAEAGIYGMVVTYSEVQNADEKNVYKVTLLIDGVEKTYLTQDASPADNASALANTSLCAFDFEGGELKAVDSTTTGATAPTSGAIAKIQDGNIALTTSGAFEAVADDVVVYVVEKDGDVVASSFAALAKDDVVELYQLDKDDKDGFDLIIVRE